MNGYYAAAVQRLDKKVKEVQARKDLDEALEKTRDSRFERHLNMPRERALETDQSWRTRSPRNRRYVVTGILGLAATSLAIGAACVLIGW